MDDEELRGRLDRIEHKVDWIGETFIRAFTIAGMSGAAALWAAGVWGAWGAVGFPISIGVVAVGSLIMQRELNRLDRRQ
jgi:hypothetical protein